MRLAMLPEVHQWYLAIHTDNGEQLIFGGIHFFKMGILAAMVRLFCSTC